MPQSATVTADILIVGAGFTGAFAAAALADGQRRIVVLDSRAGVQPHFGGELLHAAGVDILASLGLWHILEKAAGERISGFGVTADATDTPVLLPYGGVPARPGGLAIDHQEVVSRVHAFLARQPGVEIRHGVRVVDVARSSGRAAGVRTASGELVKARLVLIADGRHSRLRQTIGIAARQRCLSLSAMFMARGASLPVRGYAQICLGAPGPILAYPLRGGHVRFCVDVPLGFAPKREQLAACLRAHYAPALAEPLRSYMMRGLDSSPIEVMANHTVSTDLCTIPGAALVGDAAGCSHPLTASGMTNSLNDVRILAEELRGTGDREADIDAALTRYAVRRYRFVRIREILADELYDAFRTDGARCPAIRAGIFRYWRTSAHGRAATVAMLSGDDARVTTFMAEYLRVMRQSIQGVVVGEIDGSLVSRAHSLGGLMKESLELLNRVGAGVYTGTVR